MIIDTRHVDDNEPISCEVCIVGAGPAGIAIATELACAGTQVVMLESGGTSFEAKTNDLNKGEVLDPCGHGPLEDYRRRRLGGATTAWGGRCVPFDSIDFEARPFVPHSGWPFGKSHIDPYCARAHQYLDLGAYEYHACDALPSPARAREMISGLTSECLNTSSLYRFSPPTDLGARRRQELAASQRVQLYLYANCLEIVTNAAGTRADRVTVGTTNGKRITVAAKYFVLAAGGLEVTRLLLASNRVWTNGIGNRHDLLGRFYMCHMIHHLEMDFGRRDLVWDYEMTRDGVYCQRTISVTECQQRELALLNHRARIEHPPIEDPNHKNGVLSAAFLVKWIMRNQLLTNRLSPILGTLSRGVIPMQTREQRQSARRAVFAHGRNVLFDWYNVLRFSRRWLTERVLSQRKLPSMLLRNDANVYTLRIDAEQVPNPESRVTLSEDSDVFGQQRLRVDWRYTDIDTRNLMRTAELIGQVLSHNGVGQVRSIPAVDPKATGGHHMGTTRMAASALCGVVDENCRVHDVGNLFVASSSVFPTCSYANPTLMVMGLAIRLADHLVMELSAQTFTGQFHKRVDNATADDSRSRLASRGQLNPAR